MLQGFDKKIRLSDMKKLENFKHKDAFGNEHFYKSVWVYTPYMDNNIHMGYLDNRFFAYSRQAYGAGIDIDNPESVVKYYLDNVYFQIESMEKDMINLNVGYRSYKRALDNYIQGFR